jgi:hypothetical protein
MARTAATWSSTNPIDQRPHASAEFPDTTTEYPARLRVHPVESKLPRVTVGITCP